MKLRNYLTIFLCVSVLQSNTQCTPVVESNGQNISDPSPVNISSVRILLDQAKPMSSDLYGFNTANFFFHFNPKDAGLQAQLNNVDAPILRFPGGTTANFYHPLKKGYGYTASDLNDSNSKVHNVMRRNVEREQQYINKGWINQNFIGQFAQLCKQQGSKVMYVANLYTGTDEEVVQAVQFLLDKQVEVIGIELGNEYYLKAYQDVYPDGESYIKRAKKTAELLHQKFPNIPLAVVAAPCPEVKKANTANTKKYDAWNTILGREKFYDAIVTHLYAVPIEVMGEDDVTKVFDGALESTHRYINEDLDKGMAYYDKWYGKDHKMWITEWNVQGVFQYFGNTFLQATYFTEFATKLRQFDQVEFAMCHNLLAGGSGFNLIAKAKRSERQLTDESKFIPRITYHTAVMLRPLFEGSSSQVEVPGVPKNAHFSVSAFKNDEEGTLHVLFVNRSGKPLSTDALQLPAEVDGTLATIQSMDAENLTSGIGLNPVQTVTTAENVKLDTKIVNSLNGVELSPYSINLIEFSLKKDR